MDVYQFLQEGTISAIAIAGLVYVTRMFIKELGVQRELSNTQTQINADRHEKNIIEHQKEFKELNKEIRETLTKNIVESNIALSRSAEVTERVINILNKK